MIQPHNVGEGRVGIFSGDFGQSRQSRRAIDCEPFHPCRVAADTLGEGSAQAGSVERKLGPAGKLSVSIEGRSARHRGGRFETRVQTRTVCLSRENTNTQRLLSAVAASAAPPGAGYAVSSIDREKRISASVRVGVLYWLSAGL